MSNQLLEISSRGAFSQAWNKCIDSNASCCARYRDSIKAFVSALIFGYKIYEADVDECFLQCGRHANSIFGKECCKLKDRNIIKEPNDKLRLFKDACELKNADQVSHLLSEKDLNLSEDEQKTLLFLFVNNGMAHGVASLLKKSTENVVNGLNDEGHTLLATAVKLGYVEILMVLLGDARIDVNRKNLINGNTPLHTAIAWKRLFCFNALLGDNRIDVNRENASKNTPLHFSTIWGGCLPFCDALLKKINIEINIKNEYGYSPIDIAVIMGHTECVDLLLEHGAEKKNYALEFL